MNEDHGSERPWTTELTQNVLAALSQSLHGERNTSETTAQLQIGKMVYVLARDAVAVSVSDVMAMLYVSPEGGGGGDIKWSAML